MNNFNVTRIDGRSDSEVICGLVSSLRPGEIIPYDVLSLALSAGASRQFDRADVCSAMARSRLSIAKRLKRVMRCVRGVGYRVAEAHEHQIVAHERKGKADRQMLMGLQALQHVDWDAMDENHRRAHEGMHLILSAIVNNQRSLERRQKSIESLVNDLVRRQNKAD